MDKIRLILKCKDCKSETGVTVTKDQYNRLMKGDELIQNVLPNEPPEIRGLFISRLCNKCFNKYLRNED